MYVQYESVTITTAADGSATAYTIGLIGEISQIRYAKTDFANGSTFTLTNETTGETIWSESNVDASATRAPRQATHNTSGVAALYAAAGQPVNDKILLGNHRIKIVIANGGNAKSGTFHFMIG